MLYLKSLLAGIAAVIIFAALFVTIGVRLLVPNPPNLPDNVGYVSSSPWVPLWLPALIGLVIFVAAYRWTYQKLTKPH